MNDLNNQNLQSFYNLNTCKYKTPIHKNMNIYGL